MDPNFAQRFDEPGDAREPAPPGGPEPRIENVAPPDLLTSEVVAKLRQPPEEKTWVQTVVVLGFSLFLFYTAGLLSSSLSELALLVGVLVFHELGHYVGMRLFNYQDVKMFFIPFFGAAVSGRATSIAGYKEAIVILLGPLPGIVAGLVLGVLCWSYDSPLLRSAASLLLFINGFNLLPFMPLDGGRLLHLVLFSRERHLEAMFRLSTGLLLALIGWSISAWVLAGVGVFMALTTAHTFRVSTLAQSLKALQPPTKDLNLSSQIPPEDALPLVLAVRAKFPQLTGITQLVNTARQVWERIHIQAPGVLASLALLALYAGALVVSPVVFVVFHVWPVTEIVSRPGQDGRPERVSETRIWGQLRESNQVDEHHVLDGRHVAYSRTGDITEEGEYQSGLPHGTWTYYGPNQVKEGSRKFEDGKLVESEGIVPDTSPTE